MVRTLERGMASLCFEGAARIKDVREKGLPYGIL